MNEQERSGLREHIQMLSVIAQQTGQPYTDLTYKRKSDMTDEDSEAYKEEYRSLALNDAYAVSKWKGDTAIMVFNESAKSWAEGEGFEFDPQVEEE